MDDLRAIKRVSAALGICQHGLTDQVEIEVKTVTEDRKMRTKTTIVTYKCLEHGRHGTFTALENL